MKKMLSLFVLLFVNSLAALAQVFILNDNVFQGRMSEIKTMVLDSLTNEPVAFASVYVIPSKDTTKHEFEFNSDIAYVFYKGYAAGYGQPEWQWNAEISKNIGAFNLSVKVHDILNQTRNLTHTVTANYEEDSYRLIMGRCILFGVKWNFGKMNAAHSARAQQAAFNMVF